MNPIETFLKALGPAIGLIAVLYGGVWLKNIFDQKKRNDVEEIDLSAKKISLDVHSKPINDLVAESNKGHGVDVVKGAGDDPKGG